MNIDFQSGENLSYIAFPLVLLITSITEELVSSAPILNYYGGGWEFSYIKDCNGFSKLDDITLIFWKVIQDNTGFKSISGPQALFKYEYKGELLGIRRVLFEYGNDKTIAISDTLYVIGDPTHAVTEEERTSMEVSSVNSSGMMNVLIDVRNEKVERLRCHISSGNKHGDLNNVENLVTFTESEGAVIGFDVNINLIQKLIK